MSSKVRKSTDAGLTWSDASPPILFGLGSVVRVDPRSEKVVYVGIYGLGTIPGGVYKSVDGGVSWSARNNGLDSLSWQIRRLAINPKNPNELYLGIRGVAHRLFRSTDAGESWHVFDWGLPVTGQISGAGAIAVDTLHNRVFVGASASSPSDTMGIYILDLTTSVIEKDRKQPAGYRLYQNYPNPFNSHCRIPFELQTRGLINLEVYNLLGEFMFSLVNQEIEAGVHETIFEGGNLPTGSYFYRLRKGGNNVTKRMLLIR
jgi:hypothetical protein